MSVALTTSVAASAASCTASRTADTGGERRREQVFLAGADISMLPEIEKLGGAFRDGDGQPADAVRVLRDHGCNLFRLRLFVDPTDDFDKSYGATQDLEYVVALARRVKAVNARFMLDLHYSDTWADPGKQFKPAAWKDLEFDALQRQVHDYTAAVLKRLGDEDVMPDMVQVGNEIAGGMLWPDGKVLGAAAGQEDQQWQKFARLFNAGARACREAKRPDGKPIRVVLHIHGGGKNGLPRWFFEKFARYQGDFDVIALSFYPAWDDSLDQLKLSMAEVIHLFHKDVLVAETSYPWRTMPEHAAKATMRWPHTPQGQAQFLRDLAVAIRSAPERRGIGFIWWYPEAVPLPGRHVWRGGAEALFDEQGRPLPALGVFDSAAEGLSAAGR